MNDKFKENILIIDYPYPEKVKYSYLFTVNLLKILVSIANLWVLSDNISKNEFGEQINLINVGIKIDFLRDIHPRWLSLISLVFKLIKFQIKIIYTIIKLRRSIDLVIFFMMPPYAETIAIIFSKLLKKTTIICPLGIAPKGKIYASILCSIFEKINYHFIDYYIPEYPSTIDHLGCIGQIYNPSKVLPDAHFFVLEDEFKQKSQIKDREYIVGYIGGFREIKGIMNFVESIGIVLKNDNHIKFLVIGDGVLFDQVKTKICGYLSDRVRLINWVPHKDIPLYLDKLRLLVIPSYSESGPFIAIESMTLGTPILATNVGLIPLLIEDHKTGFILEENSPECIAENVIKCMHYDDDLLQNVANDAMALIKEKYMLKATINKWEMILNLLKSDKT